MAGTGRAPLYKEISLTTHPIASSPLSLLGPRKDGYVHTKPYKMSERHVPCKVNHTHLTHAHTKLMKQTSEIILFKFPLPKREVDI